MILFEGSRGLFSSWAEFKQKNYPKHAVRKLKITTLEPRDSIEAIEWEHDPKLRRVRIEGEVVELPKATLKKIRNIKIKRAQRAARIRSQKIREAIAN